MTSLEWSLSQSLKPLVLQRHGRDTAMVWFSLLRDSKVVWYPCVMLLKRWMLG